MSGEAPDLSAAGEERAAAGEGPTARRLGRRPGSAVSTKTPVNSKGESPSTVRPLTGVGLRLEKSGRRLEFKLDLAMTPSRPVRGPPQPNASAVNGLSTEENLPVRLSALNL